MDFALWLKIIGWTATGLTALSSIPQAIIVIKTKNTAAISLWMYVLYVAAVILWIVYGAMLGEAPIWVGNIITLLFSVVTLSIKISNIAKGKERLCSFKAK